MRLASISVSTAFRFVTAAASRDSMQILPDLVEVLDLVDEPEDAAVGLFLVELAVFLVGVADDLLDANLVLPELVAEIDDLADGDRAVQDGVEDGVLALLDALGDLDFALAREERDAPHLAEVHANGVVRLRVHPVAVVFFGVRVVARRRQGLLLVRLFLGDALRRDLHLGRGVDDLDVLVAEGAHHVIHLIGGRHVGRERVVHLFVGQEALALAHLDQLLDFFAIPVLLSLLRHRLLTFLCGPPRALRGRAVSILTDPIARLPS